MAGALLAGSILCAATAWGGAPLDPSQARFADVTLRLFTTGERQPIHEAGAFTSSLPLGKAGGLHRTVTITNETKGTSLTLSLSLNATPSLGEDGALHCVVLSEATPPGGSEPVARAKDMAFTHPGEQIMELFADARTGTRLALAVSATLAAERAPDAPGSFPPIDFLVRVEQWNGAQRVELENLQLQSLEGATVSHDYQRRVPRWVEGEPGPGDTMAVDSLPLLDLNSGTPTVQAGQGFSIPLTPKGQEKQKKELAKESAKAGGGAGAIVGGSAKKPEDKPRKIVWDQEFYHLAMEPVALSENRLSLRLAMRGQILNPVTKAPFPPVDLSVEKTLQPGQATPFYLTRETSGGPQGYVVWVIPHWVEAPPPGGSAAPVPVVPAPVHPLQKEVP